MAGHGRRWAKGASGALRRSQSASERRIQFWPRRALIRERGFDSVDGRFSLEIYLVDGTYELFRHYFAVPSARDAEGREVGAVRGVLASLLGLMKEGVTHVAVATDHVIESFRNELWAGYKTGEGVPPDLLEQFPLLEEVLAAAGIVVWPMVEFEADDALAAGAAKADADGRVERVVICTPDKDLAQCVRGTRVVQLNRRMGTISDEAGVEQKFGVGPASIPDYLALVGDSADGYPGLQGWGAKSTAAVLAKFRHLEAIPADFREWGVNVSGASTLAATLARDMERAKLFRTLATLRTDIALFDDVDQLRWKGPAAGFDEVAKRLDAAIAGSRKFPRGRRTLSVPEAGVQSEG
jgi:5'-3' exonuclease